MLESVKLYIESLSSEEVKKWCYTTGVAAFRKHLTTVDEFEHIVDYLNSDAAPKRLLKMSFKDAKRLAVDWSKSQQKKGRNVKDEPEDLETVHDFMDGTRIVRLLTKKAYQREGFFMGHCVGGYNVNPNVHIYSYRDAKNEPHATFEVQREAGQIVQIKGKGNGAIHPKYIHPILAFLRTINLNIRPSDMVNLGYYHLPKEHLDYLKLSPKCAEQIVMISGEAYAF